MAMIRLFTLLGCLQLIPAVLASWCEGEGCVTKSILDTSARFRGGTEFYPEIWQRLSSCLAEHDLLATMDNAWEQFVYANVNNGAFDSPFWLEFNPKPFATNDDLIPHVSSITISEQCNTVSNIGTSFESLALLYSYADAHSISLAAYLRSAIFICEHAGWSVESRQ